MQFQTNFGEFTIKFNHLFDFISFLQSIPCDLNPDFRRKYICSLRFDNGYRQSYEYYMFRLIARNVLGNHTEDFYVNNYNIGEYYTDYNGIKLWFLNEYIHIVCCCFIVIPDQPQDLKAINITSDSAILVWNISTMLTTFPKRKFTCPLSMINVIVVYYTLHI